MAGIVGDVPVRVGDRVAVTTLLTTVDAPGTLEAYIYVPAEHGKDLHVGLPVQLLDGSGKVLSDAHITFVSPQVDTDTQTVLAKATIENSKDSLRVSQSSAPGSSGASTKGPSFRSFPCRVSMAAFSPSSLSRTVARPSPVSRASSCGHIVGNDYVVLDGVKPGDKLVVSGTQFLQDGMPSRGTDSAADSPAGSRRSRKRCGALGPLA